MNVETPIRRRSIPVAENGRMNLPADIRRKLGLKGASTITLEEYEDRIEISSFEKRLARVREIMKPYIVPGKLVSEELIRERRAENAKDEAEAAQLGKWRG
jgi:AbrB family looped-hinge helix DNA binding protein